MSGWLNELNERWVTRQSSDLTSGVSVVVEERLFGPAGTSVVTAIGTLPSISVSTIPASGIPSAIALGSLPAISISIISGSGGQAFIPEVPADLCVIAEARDNDVITYASQMIVSYEARNDTVIASKINPIVAESRIMEVIYNASN